MMLHRFERAMERLVEGSIAGVFRLRVQPAEIGRRLERAMLDSRVASVGVQLAPNCYHVSLHPEDAATFTGWEEALSRDMETWLAEVAYAHGLTTVAPIRVGMTVDASVKRRSVSVVGRFDAPVKTPDGFLAPPVARETRRPLTLAPKEPGWPAWTLSASSPQTVGRAENNDVVLLHVEISRRHARLEPHGATWRVVDLGSTNGTWVNGERVEDATIAPGDELAFGGLRFSVGPG